MDYNGRLHRGQIEDGSWLIEGQSFNSPSAAAGGVALTKAGKHPSLDGWMYWQVKRPDDADWLPLKFLRQQTDTQTLAEGGLIEFIAYRGDGWN